MLRVWRDEIKKQDGRSCVRVTYQPVEGDPNPSPGYDERLEQLALVKVGARCLMVMCEAVDPRVVPRSIKGFNEEELFEAGEFLAIDGDVWLEIGRRVPVSSIKFEEPL